MDSYTQFADNPHIMPKTGVSHSSYEAHDSSLPADHPFVTRAAHFQYQLSPMDEQVKASEASHSVQPWWKAEEQSFAMGYMPPDLTYTDRFSAWNSGISTISDPQSPRSSNSGSVPAMNCLASPGFRQEDSRTMTIAGIDDQTSYPAPDGLVETTTTTTALDHSLLAAKPRIFEIQPDHRSPYEPDFDTWSGSQSDRNATPDQSWPSPVPIEGIAFPSSNRRSSSRQPSTSTPAASTTSTSRIRKGSTKRPTSTQGRTRRRGATNAGTGENSNTRTFVCSFAPYGCESTFVSKNEWKRHVTSQHLQLGFYRCDVGKCSIHTHSGPQPPNTTTSPPVQPNDFNRKDLFTQHHRRMHAPWITSTRRTPSDSEKAAFETSLDEVRRRCWFGLRKAPQQSRCGFCQEVFSGEGSWDARMEHVGRHFEREDRIGLGEEGEDVALREWGLNEGILTLVHGGCRLASLVGVDN
ncbi:hypothetical protein N7481_000112 [Penicillium waksmanii]|uniref:uncharacterized protein n=1 Tax=Penicillium waksmanii TaxID=69791 RepID=UPI002546EBF6|nr:uncharacterized protein N7481_000112 [Penicillium waksmanii]KAJ5999703.1 hypothetical protein N7481_000112 [Penicillium waksmanii]